MKNYDIMRDGRSWRLALEDGLTVVAVPLNNETVRVPIDENPLEYPMRWKLVDIGLKYPLIHITYDGDGPVWYSFLVYDPSDGGGYTSGFTAFLRMVRTGGLTHVDTEGGALTVRTGLPDDPLVVELGMVPYSVGDHGPGVTRVVRYPESPAGVAAAYWEAANNEMDWQLTGVLSDHDENEAYRVGSFEVIPEAEVTGDSAVVKVKYHWRGPKSTYTHLTRKEGKWNVEWVGQP